MNSHVLCGSMILKLITLLLGLFALGCGTYPVVANRYPAVCSVQAEQAKSRALGERTASETHSCEPDIMPVHQIQVGDSGVGKTVIKGTEITEFPIEVLGVLENTGMVGTMVLIRLGDGALDQVGGVAAGMSGSPIYIDGHLVGALSYAVDSSDHDLAMVTPIPEMLQLMDMLPASGDTPDRPQVLKAPPGTNVQPISVPVLASGFSSRALGRLKSLFKGVGIQSVVGTSDQKVAETPCLLQPGSAFGVQLMRGDIGLTAIGTITYVSGNAFVGLGHPLMNKGRVNYVVTGAFVHYSIPGSTIPYKIASPTAVVGTLYQDRGAGVAGLFQSGPDTLRLTVTVRDLDLGRERTYVTDVVKDQQLAVSLVGSGLLSAMDRGIDRIGAGTARVGFNVVCPGLKRSVERTNLFYSDYDISALALQEIVEGLDMLIHNEFRPVDVKEIDVEIEVQEERRTARIQSADVVSGARILPGETAVLEVVLRPYRGKSFKRELRLRVPEDTGPGTVPVSIHGGTAYYISTGGSMGHSPWSDHEDEKTPQAFTGGAGDGEGYSDLELMVAEFIDREQNNHLVAEFTPYGSFGDEQGIGMSQSTGGTGTPDPGSQDPEPASNQRRVNPQAVRVTVATDYVIEGETTVELTIAEADSAEEASGDSAERSKGPDDGLSLPPYRAGPLAPW